MNGLEFRGFVCEEAGGMRMMRLFFFGRCKQTSPHPREGTKDKPEDTTKVYFELTNVFIGVTYRNMVAYSTRVYSKVAAYQKPAPA